jgi:formylglycine-generating enzyme required for sulfatase activity
VVRKRLSRDRTRKVSLKAENASLRARVSALEHQLARGLATSGKDNLVADRGSALAGSSSGSLLMAGGTIQGDVYLGSSPTHSTEAVAIYRRVLIARQRHVHVRALLPGASDASAELRRPDLAQVYVALDTTTLAEFQPIPGKTAPLRGPTQRRGRDAEIGSAYFVDVVPVSALEAAVRCRRLILLGDPGSGKSTFVNHLGLCLAADVLEPSAGWIQRLPQWPHSENGLIPIPVVLRDFGRTSALREGAPGSPAVLWNFIVRQLEQQNLAFAVDPLEKALERGEALLLFDGLDEVIGVKERALVRDAVHVFMERYPLCRAIATCRTLSYRADGDAAALKGWETFELAPLNDSQIERFVTAWCSELGRLGALRAEEVAPETRALQRAVRRPDIRRLAPNPLLLTVMAVFHAYSGRLPDQRAQLYEDTINLLLWQWEQARASTPGDEPLLRQLLREASKSDADLYRTLAALAFKVHTAGSGVAGQSCADIMEADLQRDLAAMHPAGSKDWATKVIDAVRLRAGLLIERTSGIFAFPHRTFQEYLAGAHLAGRGNFASEALALVRRDLSLARDVLLLAVGKQVHVNKEVDRPLQLVDALCPVQSTNEADAWWRASLAGEILSEIGIETARNGAGGKELCNRVRFRLAELIEVEGLPARERVLAGDALATLEDPRFRPDAWCLPSDGMLGFVHVPSGRFIMGSEKSRDRHALDLELPQHKPNQPGYFISRFPVTVAQYRAFLVDADMKWSGEHSRREPANRPVTKVKYSEALAYCSWLDQRLRAMEALPSTLKKALQYGRVTLPSEAEWEKAARGGDGRIYPWGQKWRSETCNTGEMGIGDKCAVGCFPSGRSPYGCDDMSGNVWEWTRSLPVPYPYSSETQTVGGREPVGSARRILRGTSFGFVSWTARCAHRASAPADDRLDTVGFRMVLSPGPFGR